MKKVLVVLGIVIGLAAVIYVNYAFFTGKLMGLSEDVKQALESSETVEVELLEKDTWIVFTPKSETPETGLILFPEGRMEFRNYAPVAQKIANEGYQVIVLSRRLDREYDEAKEQARIENVMAAYPEIRQWVVGAHTWGGVVAVNYALDFPEKVSGVVLWAVRMDESGDMSGSDLPVLYVYGTLDEGNVGLVAASSPYLPDQTVWVPVEGGNRVGFGSFGPMAADVGATISLDEQQSAAARATIDFMQTLAP
ncbi:MAG: hypothetical protein JXA25_04410 [Anaerolineales bacterium]|nr:hypothetical protein [Anaerolineales bacterium]